MEAEQSQIAEQRTETALREGGPGPRRAELDLPANSYLPIGTSLGEAQETYRSLGSASAKHFHLSGQPNLELLGREWCIWVAADRDLRHTLILSDAGRFRNGCRYPFRSRAAAQAQHEEEER